MENKKRIPEKDRRNIKKAENKKARVFSPFEEKIRDEGLRLVGQDFESISEKIISHCRGIEEASKL